MITSRGGKRPSVRLGTVVFRHYVSSHSHCFFSLQVMAEYSRVTKACNERGELWEDPDFPASQTSVFYHQTPPFTFTWRRPTVSAVPYSNPLSSLSPPLLTASQRHSSSPLHDCAYQKIPKPLGTAAWVPTLNCIIQKKSGHEVVFMAWNKVLCHDSCGVTS